MTGPVLLPYASDEDWSAPDLSLLDGGLIAPPPLPQEVFGPWSYWISQFAAGVCAPPDYVAASLLAVASAAIGASRKVSPWRGWEEYAALWVMLVGDPSLSKTPVLGPFVSALKDLEQEEGADFDHVRRVFETNKFAAQELRSAWEEKARGAARGGGTPEVMPVEAVEPEEPSPPRLVTNDPTVEALTRLFKVNPRGLLLARDEAAGWIGNIDKYKGNGNTAYFLERYTGQSITVDRVSGGTITAECGLMAVLCGIQPERLTELLLKRADDGFMARFLPIYPGRAVRERPALAPDLEKLKRALRKLRGLEFDRDHEGRQVPRVVPLSAEAADYFETWWKKNGSAVGDATGFLAGLLGKGGGVVLRTALVLELLDWASAPGRPEPQSVGTVAVLASCALYDQYFSPMAERVLGGADRSREHLAARSVLRHARRSNQRVLNERELLRWKLPGLATADQVKRVVGVLEEGGWVRFIGGREGASVGRERRDWAMNPALWQVQL